MESAAAVSGPLLDKEASALAAVWGRTGAGAMRVPPTRPVLTFTGGESVAGRGQGSGRPPSPGRLPALPGAGAESLFPESEQVPDYSGVLLRLELAGVLA